MDRNLGKAAVPSGLPVRAPGKHPLLDAGGVLVTDVVCRVGHRAPPSHGAFARTRIAVMLSGVFHARLQQGAALIGRGGALLANRGTGFTFAHVDDGGDRSVVFEYSDDLVQAATGGAARVFSHPVVPASASRTAAVLRAHAAVRSADPERLRELALETLGTALVQDAPGRRWPHSAATATQLRRIAEVLRHLETHAAGDCSLRTLSGMAGVSELHFLRTVRALTGQTPRQLVIAARLTRAALALRTTDARVTDVAYDSGFGDLSHFHLTFRRAFGVPPARYRRRATT